MALPIQQSVPWATGQTSTTSDLAQQIANGTMTANGNPLYNGAYNPMYHQANDQNITLKDLASLYYKSQGQGVIGDNPHPFHAANVYRGEGFGTDEPFNFEAGGGGLVGALSRGGPVQSPDEVKKLLQARIDLAGGDKQAVFDQLVGQTNSKLAEKVNKGTGLSPQEAQALAGNAKPKTGNPADEAGIMGQWMQHYIDPYVQQQEAMMHFQADMFDQVASSIIPTMDPNKAEIMKAYLPLISAAYHQKADSFATDFLTGNGNNSLIGQLLRQQKRNASAINFLNSQNGGTSGGNFASLLGKVTG